MSPSQDEVPDHRFAKARALLRTDGAGQAVEQQVLRFMELERLAVAILDAPDIRDWSYAQANLDVAAEIARALAAAKQGEQLARRMAAAVAIAATPGGEQERAMAALFDELSDIGRFIDTARQEAIAADCVSALSALYLYCNGTTAEMPGAKLPKAGQNGYLLWGVALPRLFQCVQLNDAAARVEAFAIAAKCSPEGSAERLASVLGLLRYPQFADYKIGAQAEIYIENFAPIGSAIRHEAEAILQTDFNVPVETLLSFTRTRRA